MTQLAIPLEIDPSLEAQAVPLQGLHVHHLHRKPFPGSHSIEGLFDILRSEMLDRGFQPEVSVAPCFSKGFLGRVRNIAWAAGLNGNLFHITGDVHYLAAGLPPSRTILTIHDLVRLGQLSGIRKWLLNAFWFRMPIARSSRVTVISECTQRELLKHFPMACNKTVVIPDCVHPAFQGEHKWDMTAAPWILHIGTKSNKNLERLVQAIIEPMDGVQARLHVIGTLSDPQRSMLNASGLVYKNSTALSLQGMIDAYREANLVAFVSLEEGFGMPILEGQGMRRPVVTSDCSSMPEVAGGGALLVDPTRVESIRAGIEQVVKSSALRSDLVERGTRNLARYSATSIADRYLDLYREVHRTLLAGGSAR